MFPCLDEFFIQKDLPLRMKYFSMAMSKERGRGGFAAKMCSCEILKSVGKLDITRSAI
jgi:hypothetical protein